MKTSHDWRTRAAVYRRIGTALAEVACNMPYASNQELPLRLRERLPEHAQDIYRHAYNDAQDHYGREELASRLAWAAVKRSYEKLNRVWLPKHHG